MNRAGAVREAQRLVTLGDVDHAVAALRQIAAEFPNEPDVLLLLASALVTKGELEEAAWTAARAADLRRDDPSVVFRAAESVRWFNVAAARQYIEHTKRLLTDARREAGFVFRAELLALEGLVAFGEGDHEGAVRLLEEAHERNPGSGFIARDLAEVYLRGGRRSDALALIDVALTRGAEDDRALPGLRRLLQQIQDELDEESSQA